MALSPINELNVKVSGKLKQLFPNYQTIVWNNLGDVVGLPRQRNRILWTVSDRSSEFVATGFRLTCNFVLRLECMGQSHPEHLERFLEDTWKAESGLINFQPFYEWTSLELVRGSAPDFDPDAGYFISEGQFSSTIALPVEGLTELAAPKGRPYDIELIVEPETVPTWSRRLEVEN